MSDDGKYTIKTNVGQSFGNGLLCGDIYSFKYMTDGRLIEEVIVGDYCQWPKQEPRRFVVGYAGSKPEICVVDENRYNAYPGMMPRKADRLIDKKFYQTINNKYNSKRYVTSKKG